MVAPWDWQPFSSGYQFCASSLYSIVSVVLCREGNRLSDPAGVGGVVIDW